MPHTPDNDDAELLALRNGDDTALNRLIARWQKPLFAFAWRYLHNPTDARDLVAEVFVRLYQQRQKLAADTHLSAWLFTILTNLCHNHHRWRKRHPSISLDPIEPPNTANSSLAQTIEANDAPPPNRALENAEAIKALTSAIDHLPHELKTTLLLHHYEHMSYRDIGKITGQSERGVETRLYRARQFLKAELTPFLREAAVDA